MNLIYLVLITFSLTEIGSSTKDNEKVSHLAEGKIKTVSIYETFDNLSDCKAKAHHYGKTSFIDNSFKCVGGDVLTALYNQKGK